jgi:hypothetical protein
MAPQWRFYPILQTLQALRGIQFTTAFGMLAELGDLSRFDHPRQLTAWLGLTPAVIGDRSASNQYEFLGFACKHRTDALQLWQTNLLQF